MLSKEKTEAVKTSAPSVVLLAALFLITLAFVAILFHGPEDFRVFYVAGSKVLSGQALSLYDVRSYPPNLPFFRPAWEALVFAPFTLLSYRAAWALWLGISLMLFGASVWLLRGEIKSLLLDRDRTLQRFALVALLLPAGQILALGQDTALFLLLLVMALRASVEGRESDAGILFGLASIDLHLLLPVLLLMALRRRWEMLSSVALTGLGLFLVSTAVAGPRWVLSCLHVQFAAPGLIGYETVRYLLFAAGLDRFSPMILLVGIAVCFWLVRRLPFDRAAAWLTVAAVALNWHAVFYNYVAALPALAPPGGVVTMRTEAGSR